MSLKSSPILPGILIITSLLLAAFSPWFQSGDSGTWSIPQRIPNYNDLLNAPILVADQDRTAHAFNLESTDDNGFAIVYRQWTLEQGWTTPVDILLPAYLGVAPRLLDVILDQDGRFHLAYFGGTQESGSVYYASSLAADAADASAWSAPIPLVDDAGPLQSAELTLAADQSIVLIYSGQHFGGGLYEIHTEVASMKWSEPRLVLRSTNSDNWPDSIQAIYIPEKGIHVVWHLVNTQGNVEETWYAHLTEELSTWNQIQRLSMADSDLEFNGYPTIISDDTSLIVVFYDDFPPTRFLRRSFDGGNSWTLPVRLFEHRGGYGAAPMVKDSLGNLHMIIGNRLQNPEIHGMWYSRWLDNAWSPLTPIISGPPIGGFSPTRPEAVIVQGNVLLAAWSNDVNREFRTGSWYSFRRLDVPETPISSLPKQDQTQLVPPTSEPTPVAVENPDEPNGNISRLSDLNVESRNFLGANPGLYIFLGVSPVLILIGYLAYRRLVPKS